MSIKTKTLRGVLGLSALLAVGVTLAEVAPAAAAPPAQARAYGNRRNDLDRDGVRNRRDRDRDGDGIRNGRDRNPRYPNNSGYGRRGDFDGDGVRNRQDRDVDGDGVRNMYDDFDRDGIPNYRDRDIDNDGIPNDRDGNDFRRGNR